MRKKALSRKSLQNIDDTILNPKQKKSTLNQIRISTGCDLLDLVVGGGEGMGYPAGRIINLVGDKSAGKCIKNAYILTANGMQKIDSIGSNFEHGESYFEEEISLEKGLSNYSNKFWKEEVFETIKIKTTNGFSIQGTQDHPIMAFDENCNYILKNMSQLKEGDVCIISKGNYFFAKENYKIDYTKKDKNKNSTNEKVITVPQYVNEDIGTLLGYYIADGSKAGNFINIASSKEYCKNELDTIISSNFGISANHNCGSTTIHSIQFKNFMEYLLDYPSKFTARFKRVPKCILESPENVQCAFLRALIDNDGYKGKQNSLSYYTASEELSNQVQLMLLNLGIFTSRIGTYGATVNGKFYDNTYYDISIGGLDLRLYAELMGSKKYDFSKTLKIKDNETKKCSIDSIPFLKNKMISDINVLRKKLRWSINGRIDSYKGIERFPRYLFSGKTNITIPLLKDFVEKFYIFKDLFDINFYINILEKDYRYVYINKIEKIRECTNVYDLHIPDGHLFWSNGFISHNTFLNCEMIASTYFKYKNKLKIVYDDSESGFSFNTKKLWNVEIMPVNKNERTKSETVQDLYCNVRGFLEDVIPDNGFGIYAVDSLDGCGSRQMNTIADDQYKTFKGTKKEKEKGSYKMEKANYLSQTFFPKLADLIEKKNALLTIVSQVRTNMDMFSFEKFTRAGGKALDFYCHTVLWLAQVSKIKKKDRTIGVRIKAKTMKSKTARPYRECFITIYFDYGIDNVASNVDFLYDFLTERGALITNAKAAWSTDTETISMSSLKEFLIEIKKEKYYRKNVNTVLKRAEIIKWINADGNGLILKKFEKKFSSEMKRDDLISYIEKNNLQNELAKKVVEKWEAIEESIKSHRPPKYQ